MKPIELISILDSGMVEELRMYYNGQCTIVNIRNLPEDMPDYQIVRLWNSESGKGISVLLADNVKHEGNNTDNDSKWQI